jgi:hypothetical protein
MSTDTYGTKRVTNRDGYLVSANSSKAGPSVARNQALKAASKLTSPDYEALNEPLPNPPTGLEWVQKEHLSATQGEWMLQKTEEPNDTQEKEKKEEEALPEFYHHKVTASDTPAGICIRYNVKIQVLRELNPTLRSTQNIQTCKELKVPTRKISAAQLSMFKFENEHRSNIQALRTKAELTEAEAKYYLDLHDGDFAAAMHEALEDLHWEQANRKKEDEEVPSTDEVKIANAPKKRAIAGPPFASASSAVEMVELTALAKELEGPASSVRVLVSHA